MNLSHKTQLELLNENDQLIGPNFYSLKEEDPGFLNPEQMALLYTNSALLVTIMGFLKEQLWLSNKKDRRNGEETSYEDFITPLFNKELTSILFLKDFLIESGPKKMKKITKDSEIIESKVLSLMMERSSIDQKAFVIKSLVDMTKHFLKEEEDQTETLQSMGHQGLRLYRTFDNLDTLFELDYKLEENLVFDPTTKERLYEGAGVGVQSGYSTILLALHNIDLKQGGKIIDLGSGYGRVGLVCSLLRPDIDFTGFEYVPHRVENSNLTCKSLDLQESLNFKTQDLSLESFKIPKADVYYLYDPFTKETYHYVLKQIVEVSKNRKVTIVTKGNASKWLNEIAIENSWPSPLLLDEGNIHIYNSL